MATYAGKLKVGGTELPIGSTLYGTCATAAATAAKVVTMANFDKLITGVTIHVKFTYSNTVANPTLNVNSTGAKTIYRYGTTAPSTSVATSWNAGAVVAFTYDGTYWQMNDWNNTDTNTTYGLSISDHTVSIVSGGTTTSVTVPDNNTTYSAGTGLSLSSTTFNHSNSITAGTVGTSSATSGQTIAVPYVTYDAQGHITATGTHTHTSSVPPSGVVRGNDSTVGGLDPVTAAYIPTAASNKSFGLPANAITIEYSTDGGSTWTSYGATDVEKRNLFNESRATSFYLGKATAKANNTVNNRLRVTIEPTDRYCSFHGIYVWFSTQGNTTVMDLERSTIGAKDTYTTVFTGQALSGWSGNNIRYFSYGTFGGGSTQTGNTYKYRVTFRQTAVNTNYASSIVMDIRFLGDNLWSSPSDAYAKNMLNYRTPYSTDASGNVTFPAEVTATDFNGTDNGFSIAASVPSGAKFTDTTYSANTTSIGSASGWSAGSAPSLSYTSRSIPNVTSVGSKPSLSYTARSIPNVTSVGSVPSLSYTARSVGSASGWSAGTAASASVANGVLTITNGTAPSLTVTSVACDDITAWDAGSTPTLGTAISADDITAWSAGSVPSLTVTSTTVATGITAS